MATARARLTDTHAARRGLSTREATNRAVRLHSPHNGIAKTSARSTDGRPRASRKALRCPNEVKLALRGPCVQGEARDKNAAVLNKDTPPYSLARRSGPEGPHAVMPQASKQIRTHARAQAPMLKTHPSRGDKCTATCSPSHVCLYAQRMASWTPTVPSVRQRMCKFVRRPVNPKRGSQRSPLASLHPRGVVRLRRRRTRVARSPSMDPLRRHAIPLSLLRHVSSTGCVPPSALRCQSTLVMAQSHW